jgi:HPt (histidine-containing phosphotransfer) domain-containing protein
VSDPVDEAFQQLRREYAASLPERLAELQSDLASCREGTEASLASLRVRLHRLAGSGGSYGFLNLSAIAREAERAIASDARHDQLGVIVDRLAQAVAEAQIEVGRVSG